MVGNALRESRILEFDEKLARNFGSLVCSLLNKSQ